MDEKGNMGVPEKDEDVAWYNLGYKPGDNGSAVLAGHFDTKTGAPAVFYNLSDLKKGDEITVEYAGGTEFTFTVEDETVYPFDNFPLQKVFNTSGSPRLNLITCDGVFDTSSHNYSQRRVVYAVLKD
jgi:LPXTG-site transpeptidase (sortase) family protein